MPYRFDFIIKEPEEPVRIGFSCKLASPRCEGTTVKGDKCKRKVSIGTPYCTTHLKRELHLRIGDSLIPGAGKGLFAYDPDDPDGNEIVFHPGDVIVQYDGEMITNAELDRRYGDYTAPYGIQIERGGVYTEDGACRRGVGTLANHKTHSKANAYLSFGTKLKRFQLIAKNRIYNGREIYVSYTSGRNKDKRYMFKENTLAHTRRSRR